MDNFLAIAGNGSKRQAKREGGERPASFAKSLFSLSVFFFFGVFFFLPLLFLWLSRPLPFPPLLVLSICQPVPVSRGEGEGGQVGLPSLGNRTLYFLSGNPRRLPPLLRTNALSIIHGRHCVIISNTHSVHTDPRISR